MEDADAFEFYDEAEAENAELFYEDLLGLSPSFGTRAPFETTPTVVDPLARQCRAGIEALVTASPLRTYRWPRRGRAPTGYLQRMAFTYARVYCKLKAQDPFAVEMAKRAGSSRRRDALALYSRAFAAKSMSNAADGVDTLRHVFVLLTGLGMLESSGRYNLGRDRSASNTSSTTAEAGLFQISYTVGVGSSSIAGGWLKRQYDVLKQRPYSGLRNVFSQGVPARTRPLRFRTDRGGKFRKFLVEEPALGAEVAALGIRKRLRHWGPLRRGQVTINPDCDQLFKDVQALVDREDCCRPRSRPLTGVPGGPIPIP